MNYPLRIPLQLKSHLRALRKRRGLTQAELGALVGVKQARIAEIEANPGAVSMDQLTKVLSALGGTLHLHADDAGSSTAQRVSRGTSRRSASAATAPKAPGAVTGRAQGVKGRPSPGGRPQAPTKSTASRAGVVIPAKKGTW